jgi:hypothetical protein
LSKRGTVLLRKSHEEVALQRSSTGRRTIAQIIRPEVMMDRRIFVGRLTGGLERPSKFELAINMKTAKAIGLTIPQALLLRADELIQ